MTAANDEHTAAPAPALKEIFSAARLRAIAAQTAAVYPAFDAARFLALALPDLDTLELMQRLRHTTECLHATLPDDYHAALDILRSLAPRINHGFASMILPDYVARYGLDDPAASLDALRFFTTFGSSEFAIRALPAARSPAHSRRDGTVVARRERARPPPRQRGLAPAPPLVVPPRCADRRPVAGRADPRQPPRRPEPLRPQVGRRITSTTSPKITRTGYWTGSLDGRWTSPTPPGSPNAPSAP